MFINYTITFILSRRFEKLEVIVVYWINPTGIDSDSKLFRNPSTLKSVVFVATPAEVFANQVGLFDVREGFNLTTFWCNLLKLYQINNLNKLTSVAWSVPEESRDQRLPINILHPDLQLGHLESYWEPERVLMRSVLDSPTKLKLISCFYNAPNFPNFCEHHPLLEVLKLGIGTGWYENLIDLNEDSWRTLSKLRILSLETALIRNIIFSKVRGYTLFVIVYSVSQSKKMYIGRDCHI